MSEHSSQSPLFFTVPNTAASHSSASVSAGR